MEPTPVSTDPARTFLCPICAEPRAVRITKKDKPYLICDPCGVQVFIRGRSGIERFARLLERAQAADLLTRFNASAERYRLTCANCAHVFWIEPHLIETSIFDGSLKGVRCPASNCGAVVPWKVRS